MGKAIQGAVAIIKDQKSQIRYQDVGLTPAKGAAGGLALGAVLGILTGGVGLVLGALGGLVGGLVGGLKRGEGFSEVRLNEVVASLAPGTSALVALVESTHVEELHSELEVTQAEIFSAPLSADLAEKLDEHRQDVYTVWMNQLEK